MLFRSKDWFFTWKYNKALYKDGYEIEDLKPICKCKCDLLTKSRIDNIYYGTPKLQCPNCKSTYNKPIEDDLDLLESLKAEFQEDVIDENKPLIKQIDVPNVMTYDNVINEYEDNEESNAVISTEELEKVTRDRMDTLGLNDNQAAIAKYEEEQEKKAIISYEQLLKNASNITLSYKKENNEKGCPKINKIEVKEKEVTQAISYLEEEEFLKILKEFRLSL